MWRLRKTPWKFYYFYIFKMMNAHPPRNIAPLSSIKRPSPSSKSLPPKSPPNLTRSQSQSLAWRAPPSSSNPWDLAMEAGIPSPTPLLLLFALISATAATIDAMDSISTPMRIAIPCAGPVPSLAMTPRR